MRRGEVWWASLPEPTGFGPGSRRPVLVVIVAVITSDLRLAEAPGNVRCRRSETRLPRDSVVNVSQLITVDKSLLTERVAVLPTGTFHQVEDGLRLVLSL
jgi:mRNA interferase MazF